MNETLANVLGTMLAVILAALTPLLVVLAKRAGEYLASLAKVKLSEEQTAKIEWAVRTSVDAAEEAGRTFLQGQLDKGAAKRQLAKQTARSLAPKALAPVDEQQLDRIVDAAVERKRSSTPSLSLMPMSMSGASLIPLSLVPMRAGEVPLPPPSSVPSFETRPTPTPPRRNP